jgi:UDP-2,4-diacetamido-2,4,6-trideoxy-beta-L-altropyranose hydrolase
MPPRPIIIRADASIEIGSGHVMRCLALAEALQSQGGNPAFVMAQSTAAIDQYLRDEGMELIHILETPGDRTDADQLIETARIQGAEWIVVDGYQFDESYQRAIKKAGFKLFFMDDDGRWGHYFADIVLNQNITARQEMYSKREPYTTLLLGTKYVMLRREFVPWLRWQRSFPEDAKRILVTMGGSDPEGLTLPLVKALTKIRDVETTVVVGGSNPRIADLQHAAREFGPQLKLLTDVRDMAGIMADSDLAVICGGGTLWELLYMGVATLTYSRAGVQKEIIDKLCSAGAVIDLGPIKDFDESCIQDTVGRLILSLQLRQSLGQEGRKLVDGNGSSRVLRTVSLADSTNSVLPLSTDLRN